MEVCDTTEDYCKTLAASDLETFIFFTTCKILFYEGWVLNDNTTTISATKVSSTKAELLNSYHVIGINVNVNVHEAKKYCFS